MIAGRTVVVNSDESETGDGYQCDNCGKVFAYRYYRDKHMKYTRCIDHGDRQFPCQLCNRLVPRISYQMFTHATTPC